MELEITTYLNDSIKRIIIEYVISGISALCHVTDPVIFEWYLTILCVNSDEIDRRLMFHYSCSIGNLNIAKYIRLKLGMNCEPIIYQSILKEVCRNGYLDVCAWLIDEYGLNKYDMIHQGDNLVKVAHKSGHEALVKFLQTKFELTPEECDK